MKNPRRPVLRAAVAAPLAAALLLGSAACAAETEGEIGEAKFGQLESDFAELEERVGVLEEEAGI